MSKKKVLWNTIKIEVPSDMVNINKKDNFNIKNTLTNTNNISKANKEPSIKIIPGNIDKPKIISEGKQYDIEQLKIKLQKVKELKKKNEGKEYKKVKTENEIVKNYTKKINEKITKQKATIEKEKEFIPIKNFADFKNQLKQAVKKDKAHIKKVKNELNNNQWTIKTLNNQLMDDKIHNYKDYQKYTKKNTESNFPKELFLVKMYAL